MVQFYIKLPGKGFPLDVRKELGKAIFELQKGIKLEMPLSRKMTDVFPGVEEIRIKDKSGNFRVFYWMKTLRGIFIFHAFKKKTMKTPKKEIETGRKRLKEMIDAKN